MFDEQFVRHGSHLYSLELPEVRHAGQKAWWQTSVW